jgi:hypothetical protein
MPDRLRRNWPLQETRLVIGFGAGNITEIATERRIRRDLRAHQAPRIVAMYQLDTSR